MSIKKIFPSPVNPPKVPVYEASKLETLALKAVLACSPSSCNCSAIKSCLGPSEQSFTPVQSCRIFLHLGNFEEAKKIANSATDISCYLRCWADIFSLEPSKDVFENFLPIMNQRFLTAFPGSEEALYEQVKSAAMEKWIPGGDNFQIWMEAYEQFPADYFLECALAYAKYEEHTVMERLLFIYNFNPSLVRGQIQEFEREHPNDYAIYANSTGNLDSHRDKMEEHRRESAFLCSTALEEIYSIADKLEISPDHLKQIEKKIDFLQGRVVA